MLNRGRIVKQRRWKLKSVYFDETYTGTLVEALKQAVEIGLLETGWPSAVNKTVSVSVELDEPKGETFEIIVSTPNRQKRF